MNDVTQLLNAASKGDQQATAELLPLIYSRLRRMAAKKMFNERASHTLSATALVHEAYVKLVKFEGDDARKSDWDGEAHFFAVAGEAMRRILIDHARAKQSMKRGGDRERVDLTDFPFEIKVPLADLLAVDEALDDLKEIDELAAQVVKLHHYVGMTILETASALQVSERSAYRKWNFARTWLFKALNDFQNSE